MDHLLRVLVQEGIFRLVLGQLSHRKSRNIVGQYSTVADHSVEFMIKKAAADGHGDPIRGILTELRGDDIRQRVIAVAALSDLSTALQGHHLRREVVAELTEVLRHPFVLDPKRIEGLNSLQEEHARKTGYADQLGPAKVMAAEILGKLTDQNSLDALCEATSNPHKGVRRASVWALGRFQRNDSQVIAALEKSLNDTDADVRGAAIDALKSIGTTWALDVLNTWRKSRHAPD